MDLSSSINLDVIFESPQAQCQANCRMRCDCLLFDW